MQYIPNLVRISAWPLEASEFRIQDFNLKGTGPHFYVTGGNGGQIGEPFLHTQTKPKDSECKWKCNWAEKRHNEVEKWLK